MYETHDQDYTMVNPILLKLLKISLNLTQHPLKTKLILPIVTEDYLSLDPYTMS